MEEKMFDYLKPDYYYSDIFSIDLNILKKQGIKGVICDIDNTIVAWSNKEILEKVYEWIQLLEEDGFSVCLVSNGLNRRVSYFRENLEVPAVGQAVKPRKKAYKKAQKILGLKSTEIVVIGDQIFTDILGGNRLDFLTILVDPVDNKEFFTTRIMRCFERLIFTRKNWD
jgi:hypothetical protein